MVSILDVNGKPFKANGNGKARRELVDAFVNAQNKKRPLRAEYDSAQTTDEYKNIWSATDALDADSANSSAVRQKLVQRSRYEHGSNGYAAGIENTYTNDLVGTGPSLRMQTGSEDFNRMVERVWREWAKETGFRRKLWCMAHAYGQDGEGFGILRQNPGLRHRVKIDMVLIETEQCQTPYLPFNEDGYIDGIRFDDFGNPVSYDILRDHPGAGSVPLDLQPERVPARFVAHWFKMRRPGQHRGIPEGTPTLNCGAASRRFRESVLSASDNIANYALFLRTKMDPDQLDTVSPMSTLDIERRMMTALPEGWDAFQPRAEQPVATYESFHKSLINEQARPRNMPLNKALCDSSDYNFASGRLDHITYYDALDIDRADCADMVLDVVFRAWFDLAVVAFRWLGGNPLAISEGGRMHVWDFPKHKVADLKSEAQANQTRLATGQTSLPTIYSDAGDDYEDEVIKEATANGITVEQQKQINLLRNVPPHAIQQVASILGIAQPEPEPAPEAEPEDEEEPDEDEAENDEE
ncbi:MAG: phage portal protein [Woeseia sp.]|nr:phage portal protein [Woeseia sp.]